MLGRKTKTTQPRPITDGVVPAHNVVDLRPHPAKKTMDRHQSLITVVILLLIAATVGTWLLIKHHKPSYKPNTLTTIGNVNYVTDDPQGVKFAITKDFTVMEPQELKQTNPFNIYGFKQADVANVACIISQTKRTQRGTINPNDLAQGTLNQVKKSFPDTQSGDYQPITFKNNREAIRNQFKYHDRGVEIRQAEIVATTDTRATFAYCTSPSSLFDHYLTDFNNFFSSLEIY